MIHQSLVGSDKATPPEKFWPMWSDKTIVREKIVWGNTPEEAKAEYDRIIGVYKKVIKD